MNDQPAKSATVWESPHRAFLAIAYAVSWICWLAAWALSRSLDTGDVLHNQDAVWRVGFVRDVPIDLFLVSLLSLVGAFGPMIGGVIMARRDPAIAPGHLGERLRRIDVGWNNAGLVLGILALVTVPSLVISMVAMDRSVDGPSNRQILPLFLAFLVVQGLTSGTEEIGWRGYLTEKMLRGNDFWDTGWSVGLVWAVWHYPVVVFIFMQQGMIPVQIVGSLAGFTMGIIAMAVLHAWFYERTGSVFLNLAIHAIFNAVPLTIVLLFKDSPAALLSNLLLWAVVIGLKRRYVDAAPGSARQD